MQALLWLFKLAACGTSAGTGLPSLYDDISCDADGVPQINSVEEAFTIVANVSRILIALSGGIAIAIIVVAAIYYVTSTGDPARIKRAKEILINTTIGLVLIIAAYAIVTLITNGF